MKKNLIILHGWQSKTENWQFLINLLTKEFKIYLPDLPGFGKNKIKSPLALADYVNWLKKFILDNNISKPILLGHSHGGRIALKYCSQGFSVEKLILIAAAGFKPKKGIKQYLGLILAKIGKVIFIIFPLSFLKNFFCWLLYSLLREKDYYQADKNLKLTMINLLKEDLSLELDKIGCPTLILWGNQDKITPLSWGKKLAARIPKTTFYSWENGHHSLPFTHARQVAQKIIKFCNESC